jgi:raffinose/stachyose/melibiose transport system permease protein
MKKFKKIIVKLCVALYAALFLIISILPFYLMLINSVKSSRDYGRNGFFSMPQEIKLSNYVKVFEDGIFIYFKNSLIVTIVSLVLLLFVALCASYAFSRMKLKWTNTLFMFVVACMSISIHVALIPIYLLTRDVGLYDTLAGLVGPYVAFNLPITIFILTNFMKEIPVELEEAAKIDGCGHIRLFSTIIVPLSKAGIVTVAIYDAIAMWNEFSFALVLTQSPESRTLPLALWNYKGQYSSNVPMLFAVLFISVIPMILAFTFGQDKLIKGMMAGAVKG